MSMEDIELDIGGTKFKGVWIAILFSFASTIGGGIWAASEFFSRLETLEETVEDSMGNSETVGVRFEDFREVWMDDKKTLTSDIEVIKSQLDANDITGLQGKLAELGTNLKTIMERQQELLGLQERVVAVEKLVTEMQTTVQKAENATASANEINSKLNTISKEIENLWEGMDYLSNPYGN